MKLEKQQLQDYLNSFDGDFREIFFEKSKGFNFNCINGIFKTPHFSSLEGFSVLSRIKNKEYFKVFSGFGNIKENIEMFKNEFFINECRDKKFFVSTGTILNGEKILELENIENTDFEVKKLVENIEKLYKKYIESGEKKSLISSSEISIILSKKSFIVGNSEGNFSKDNLFYSSIIIKLIGEKNDIKEEILEKIYKSNNFEYLTYDNLEKHFVNAIQTLEKQLSGDSSPSGKIDVIIGNEAGGTIFHEAVGHGLEADLLNSSIYKDKLGQRVANDIVTIVDNPTTKFERGYYKTDHEGYDSTPTVLIENGILKSYLHNIKTAKKFEVVSTGHGRKQSYKHKTLVRMGNTYLLPGKDKKEDLIAKVKSGLYVSSMGGGQVNTTSGDFVFKVQNGFLIENGKLTKAVRGATISGNGPEMLYEIYGICDDLDFFDGGTCGKGQSMPVSDGTPTILTKLNVSGV